MDRFRRESFIFKLIRKSLLKDKSFLYKFFRYSSSLALVLVTIQIAALLFIALDNRQLLIRQLTTKITKALTLSLYTFHPADYINYFTDSIKSLDPARSLPRLDLNIKYKSLLFLDCQRKALYDLKEKGLIVINQKCPIKDWSRATLIYKNNNYPVKLRGKGDRKMHYQGGINKMSFKVDIRGEKRLFGMEEFSLQSPAIRNYTAELFATDLVKNESIVVPRQKYVRLYLNGEYLGLRHIEEAFTREMIEASKRRYGPIFSLAEDLSTKFEDSRFDLANALFWQQSNPILAQNARSILESLKLENRTINNKFDIKLWAKYFAILDTYRFIHGTLPKSVRFYLNPITGLIEPIFFDGHHLTSGFPKDFYLTDLLVNPTNINVSNCWVICHPKVGSRYFYSLFFGTYERPNTEFYKHYIAALNTITSPNYVNQVARPFWEKYSYERGHLYRNLWRKDGHWNLRILPHIASWNNINTAIQKRRKYLEDSFTIVPSFQYDERNSLVHIRNDYSRIPQLLEIQCNKNLLHPIVLPKGETKVFKMGVGTDCDPKKTRFSVNGFRNIFTLASAYTTNKSIEVELQNLNNRSTSRQPKSQAIITFSGKQNITKPLEFSYRTIILKPNSEICLKNSAYIQIKNSTLIVEGTSLQPSIIRTCNDLNSTFLGQSLIFDNSVISGGTLKLSSLYSPKKSLRVLYGGVNFINSKIKLNRLVIQNSNSEDGVNFMNSNARVGTLLAENIESDAIDSDFSELDIGKVKCSFIMNDCLDLSYSNANISTLEAFEVGDKVISLGESSALRVNSVSAVKSQIGLVSKDSSKLYVDNFIYSKVLVPIAAFIKKPEFGNPLIHINKISKLDNSRFLISSDSNVTVMNENLDSSLSSEKIKNMLYGNLYGIKTKR